MRTHLILFALLIGWPFAACEERNPAPPDRLSASINSFCLYGTRSNETVCWAAASWYALPSVSGPYRSLTMFGDNTCGVTIESGRLQCWGDRAEQSMKNAPEQGILTVALSSAHLCAIMEDSSLKCWNGEGDTTPEALQQGRYSAVECSGACCALASDGRLQCWSEDEPVHEPYPGMRLLSFTMQGPGVCGITLDMALRCVGNWPDEVVTTSPPRAYTKVVSRCGGALCALSSEEGRISCWGGNASFTSRIPATAGFVDIAMSTTEFCKPYVCGLHKKGTLYCWSSRELELPYTGPPATD